MLNFENTSIFELIYVIVNYGMGSKVLQKAKKHGITGGTIFLAKGTVNDSLLNFLSIYEEKKEIVLMGTDSNTADQILFELNKKFQFEKPNHGIVFTTSMCAIVGCLRYKSEEYEERRGVNNSMYQNIITIVNRGKAEEVIEAAKAAGSKGGTIINARGSGENETSRLFNMDIEPEKEMVLIVSKKDVTEAIVATIRETLEIDKPGNGIIFIQDINKTYGVYE